MENGGGFHLESLGVREVDILGGAVEVPAKDHGLGVLVLVDHASQFTVPLQACFPGAGGPAVVWRHAKLVSDDGVLNLQAQKIVALELEHDGSSFLGEFTRRLASTYRMMVLGVDLHVERESLLEALS